jgi:hypothetical protein
LVQIFLQGKLLGVEAFLADASGDDAVFAGRCLYASLLAEAVPRALLARLGLSPELLGTSGGGQFLAVLAVEHQAAANEFLTEVTRKLSAFTGAKLRLAWALTENLGAWSDVRLSKTTDSLNHSSRRRARPMHFTGISGGVSRILSPFVGSPGRKASWLRPSCPCPWRRTRRSTGPEMRPLRLRNWLPAPRARRSGAYCAQMWME